MQNARQSSNHALRFAHPGNLSWRGLTRWARFRMHPYRQQFLQAADLPVYTGPTKLYLIATTPRCGSHFVGHAIGSTGHLGFPLEYLHQRNIDMWKYRFGESALPATFDRIVRVRSGPSGWFGIKAHWNQYRKFEKHLPVLERYGGFRCAVWLYRKNLLSQAISHVIAQQTRQWIEGAPSRGRPRYDYGAIVQSATMLEDNNRSWQHFFAERFTHPVKAIAFEDIVKDQDRQLADIVRFIDPDSPRTLDFQISTERQSNQTSAAWKNQFADEARPEDRWILEPRNWGL